MKALLIAIALLAFTTTWATAAGENPPVQNLLIIGASSLTGLDHLLGAMLESRGIRMHIESQPPRLDQVGELLKSEPVWDYLIMDAWHFGRGDTSAPPFPAAVEAFVKQVRAHSPNCKIILFAWWLPSPTATESEVLEVFHRCAVQAERNHIWVATTGPAFTEARLRRPDWQIVVSKTDSHPARDGSYLNACSLFALITGQSPVGLPSTLTFPPATELADPPPQKKVSFTVAPEDARGLQELAWKIYQRELPSTKPGTINK